MIEYSEECLGAWWYTFEGGDSVTIPFFIPFLNLLCTCSFSFTTSKQHWKNVINPCWKPKILLHGGKIGSIEKYNWSFVSIQPNKGLWDSRIKACWKGVMVRSQNKCGRWERSKSYEDNLGTKLSAFPHVAFLEMESWIGLF